MRHKLSKVVMRVRGSRACNIKQQISKVKHHGTAMQLQRKWAARRLRVLPGNPDEEGVGVFKQGKVR